MVWEGEVHAERERERESACLNRGTSKKTSQSTNEAWVRTVRTKELKLKSFEEAGRGHKE